METVIPKGNTRITLKDNKESLDGLKDRLTQLKDDILIIKHKLLVPVEEVVDPVSLYDVGSLPEAMGRSINECNTIIDRISCETDNITQVIG